ncbi:GDP-mannose transporter [Nosema granulosis]|uniref:GDP-mannose transporter n=1 Tax=Nosema granulosis TaxID=83296 RepID=A0A9P6KZA5_9MICR|nr:GDP-mannose transporter [Nosema granulosis]
MIAIPMIGLLAYLFETTNISDYNSLLVSLLVISSICALLTALTTSFVLKYLSSTTFSMIGAFNKILMGFSGLVFLRESINFFRLLSLLIGAFSTLLYINSLRFKKMIN